MSDSNFDAEWILAIRDFQRHGYPEDLAEMLESDREVPFYVRSFLAAYITGRTVIAQRRGKHNAQLRPRHVREIEAALLGLYRATEWILINITEFADERRQEEREIRRTVDEVRAAGLQRIAGKYGVSVSRVRELHKAKEDTSWARVEAGELELDMVGPMWGADVVAAIRTTMLAKARQILDDPEAFDPFSE
ncbi:hypothetical protein PMO31116_03590 [Pandoraea morbifera]|uniref:Uncharacterized protein n=1 Tax=Pandoraea morbifera TaxID=2508300 RepID=A0A5E4X2U8_9BURK|nr:hypothetical protein [Pandoraea morbifera]VVE30632.1 hypothetical protein PMO31116_03590 [Pandoraea morbifera]